MGRSVTKVTYFCVFAIFSSVLTGCTTGPMDVREVHYYAVPNGETTNYYRLRVGANTKLGVAKYSSGWYPTRAVDNLFGTVSAEGGVTALAARAKIESDISDAIQSTNKAWLDEAAKATPEPKTLEGLFEARRRVLAYPNSAKPPYRGGFEIEYNPSIGVALMHADEKLVFILSSNPDEIIGKIKNFSENEQTVLTINQLSGVIVQRNRNEVGAQAAVEEINKKADTLVFNQIKTSLDKVTDTGTKPGEAIIEIDTLVNLIDAIQPQRVDK